MTKAPDPTQALQTFFEVSKLLTSRWEQFGVQIKDLMIRCSEAYGW